MRAFGKKLTGSAAPAPAVAPKGVAPPAVGASGAAAPPLPGAPPRTASGPVASAGPAAAPLSTRTSSGGFGSAAAAAAFETPLPAFRDVPASERQALFAKKLHLCSYAFDFTNPGKHVREKDVKRATLLELVEYVNTGQGKFTEALFDDITFMLSNNLFRALPPCGHETTGVGAGEPFDAEEEEPALEPAWPHLQARAPPTLSPAARTAQPIAASRRPPPDCVRVPAALRGV